MYGSNNVVVGLKIATKVIFWDLMHDMAMLSAGRLLLKTKGRSSYLESLVPELCSWGLLSYV